MITEACATEGFPEAFVTYWGHDPEDEMFYDIPADDISGFYDVFMIPDDRIDEFWSKEPDISGGLAGKLSFKPLLITHSAAATRQHYPEIHEKAMAR
jgi:hypothetical protein